MVDIVRELREYAEIQSHEEWHFTRPKLLAAADEIERLRDALRQLTYEREGKHFCAIIGDAEITDIVANVIGPSVTAEEEQG